MRLRSIGAIAAIIAVSGLFAFVAAPSADAGDTEFMKIAKRKSGPYQGEPFKVNIAAGAKRNLYLKVKPNTEHAQDVLVENIAPDYNVKYFRGDNNITAEVEGSGFYFDSDNGIVKFRMRVKRQAGAPAADCLQLYNEDASLVVGFNAICK